MALKEPQDLNQAYNNNIKLSYWKQRPNFLTTNGAHPRKWILYKKLFYRLATLLRIILSTNDLY